MKRKRTIGYVPYGLIPNKPLTVAAPPFPPPRPPPQPPTQEQSELIDTLHLTKAQGGKLVQFFQSVDADARYGLVVVAACAALPCPTTTHKNKRSPRLPCMRFPTSLLQW